MTGEQLLESLGRLFGNKIEEKTEFRGETTFRIHRENNREVAKFCRDDLSFDYLLDIETMEPDRARGIFPGDGPERPVNGSCQVVLAGSDRQAMLKRDGDWWGFQIQGDEVTVSVVASGPVHQAMVLSEVEDLPALIHDRAGAIAERVAEAGREGPP